MISLSPKNTLLVSFPVVLLYGLFVRLTFAAPYLQDNLGGLIGLAFIFVVPFVLGVLTMAIMPRQYKSSIAHAVFMPWLSFLLVAVALLIFAWEILICIVMAIPIYLPLSSAGGLLFYAIVRRRSDKKLSQMSLIAFLLAPYMIGMIEQQIPSPESIRTVDTQIVIDAPAEIVWQQITSVPEIQPSEHHPAFFHLTGMPKPIQAMLPQGGVGTVRWSSYEGGLLFTEVVTEWEPQQGFDFTIDLDSESEPPWPWNQIGGPSFDILDGTYRIEPLDEGRVILHLSSRHRLATKLNSYGGFWTDLILSDIQNYILTVIKGRAELEKSFVKQ